MSYTLDCPNCNGPTRHTYEGHCKVGSAPNSTWRTVWVVSCAGCGTTRTVETPDDD